MNNIELTNRQIQLLKIIVDEYTYSATPVSSKLIAHKFMRDLSPQTIRNELHALEKLGYLEKTHTSSGRIPSTQGYKYYEQHILKPEISNDIKNKLRIVLEKRDLSIDTIIDESASLIEEILKLPTVIHSQNNDALLKRFDLVSINENQVLVLLITSDGEIIKNTIEISNKKQLDDVIICVRIFNDRLVDTKLSEIPDKLPTIKEIIRKSVHQYEFCIQQVIEKIFNYNTTNPKTNIYGIRNLALQPEFQNVERLHEVLNMLENTSVWKHIAYTQEQAGNNQITFSNDIGVKDITVASATIHTKNSDRQISVVGPSRMNYAQVKGLLLFIKEELERINKMKEEEEKRGSK